MNGVGTGGLRCKPVIKMDEHRDVVKEYVSYRSAKRDVGYSFEKPIKNRQNLQDGVLLEVQITKGGASNSPSIRSSLSL